MPLVRVRMLVLGPPCSSSYSCACTYTALVLGGARRRQLLAAQNERKHGVTSIEMAKAVRPSKGKRTRAA